jgi:hypothetical protein
LRHSDGFRIDDVTHRAAQAVAFCKRFVRHRGPLFTLLVWWKFSINAEQRLLYLGDAIQAW